MKGLVYRLNPIGWVTCKWLKLLWRGCLLSRLNGLSLRELSLPELPGREWVRCRSVLSGICGSDLAVLLQCQPPDSFLQAFASLPAVMGHENVAVVDEVGPAVDPQWLGKRVCVDPALSCRVRGIDPPCPACAHGHFGACENFSADGEGKFGLPPGACLGFCAPVGGSWSAYFLAHACQLVEVPAGLSDAQAVLTDPLACSLHAVGRADLSSAGNVLIYGAGTLGLGLVWALRRTGYAGRIDVIARHRHQGRLARQLGATEVLFLPAGRRARFETIARRSGARVVRARLGSCMLSGGYDAVFECTGQKDAIEEALKWARSRGQVIIVGMGHGRGADMTAVWFGELTVVGASGRGAEQFQAAGPGAFRQDRPPQQPLHTYQLVHELMLSGGPDVSGLLTHTFELADYKSALATAMAKGAHRSIKVAFRFPLPGGAAAQEGSRA